MNQQETRHWRSLAGRGSASRSRGWGVFVAGLDQAVGRFGPSLRLRALGLRSLKHWEHPGVLSLPFSGFRRQGFGLFGLPSLAGIDRAQPTAIGRIACFGID